MCGFQLHHVLAESTVSRLVNDLSSLSKQLLSVARSMSIGELTLAATAIENVWMMTKTFKQYATDELQQAHDTLSCCKKVYHVVEEQFNWSKC